MKRQAFIWRKSIYENDFRCNVCGAKLFNSKKGKLIEKNIVVLPGNDSNLFCIKCRNHVAKVREIDCEGTEILRGQWKETDNEQNKN